eukprot:TRINITY_DN11998_c0_g1_i1.p1 TRINITY_DN11998_c0_g1~~TRINITY_DN11998_c0_g1_i1.p1  ORF type:complete len:483 (+),score=118.33 TRINITY_DN11998_c0_g1_i1:2627-4075(+)
MDAITIALIVVGALGVIFIPIIIFILCSWCHSQATDDDLEASHKLIKVSRHRATQQAAGQRNLNEADSIQRVLFDRASYLQDQGRAFYPSRASVFQDAAVQNWEQDIDNLDSFGNTLLMWAVFLRDERATDQLLRNGADPNVPCHHSKRPLHQACLSQHARLVTALLNHGADANVRDNDAMTPLLLACTADDAVTTQLLLDRSDMVDVNLRSHRGMGPLLLAASCSANAAASVLLRSQQMDVNQQDTKGWTCLHWCAATDNQGLLAELMRHDKVQVDAVDNTGDTCVHAAAKEGHKQTIKLIVNACKPNQRLLLMMQENDAGQTPFELATANGYDGCAEAIAMLKATVEAAWLYKHGEDELIPRALAVFDEGSSPIGQEDPRGISGSESGDDTHSASTSRDASRSTSSMSMSSARHANKAANGLRKKPTTKSRSEYMKQRRQKQKAEREAAEDKLLLLETEEAVLREALEQLEQDKQAMLQA